MLQNWTAYVIFVTANQLCTKFISSLEDFLGEVLKIVNDLISYA